MAPPPAARPSAPEPPLHSRATRLTFPGARSPGSARSPKRRSPRAAPRSGSGEGGPSTEGARRVGAPACGPRAARRAAGRGKRRMLSPLRVGVGAVPVTPWNGRRFAPRRSDINTLWRLLPGRCFPNSEREQRLCRAPGCGCPGQARRARRSRTEKQTPTRPHSVHPALQLVTASKWS